MYSNLSPYAVAHIRLLEIRKRFRAVKQRQGFIWYWMSWQLAKEEGERAIERVLDDQNKFDHLLRN